MSVYQPYKALDKVERFSKRDLYRLVRVLFQEKTISKVVEKLCVASSKNPGGEVAEKWWARGDLNPGPPPCKGGVLTRLDDGPAPRRGAPCLVVVDIKAVRGKCFTVSLCMGFTLLDAVPYPL